MVEPTEPFKFDMNCLDEHWLAHAKTVHEYAVQAAEVQHDYDRLKRKRDVLKDRRDEIAAEVKQSIRKNPESYDCVKITEPAVEEILLSQDRYRRAQQRIYEAEDEIIAAKHRLGLIEAMITGLAAKKTSMEKVQELWFAAYFAEPRASANSQEHVADLKKKNARSKGRLP